MEQYYNEILLAIFAFGYFTIESFHDFYVIEWKRTAVDEEEKKFSNLWHRIDVLMHLSVIVFVVFFPVKFLFPQNFFAVLLFAVIRFFQFDTLLNKLRGLKLNYIGITTDLDKLLSRININPIVVKSFLFVVALTLFVISKNW
jgi:hypothetical protein